MIGGTGYNISGGKTRVNGTVYNIKGGRTLVNSTAYQIAFGPKPLPIYSAGDQELQNGAEPWGDEGIDFVVDCFRVYSKYGWAIGFTGIELPMAVTQGYKKLLFTVWHNDKGIPDDARVGWGNGNYAYNFCYYRPPSYENYGTTNYQEESFSSAKSPAVFELDISSVAGIEDIDFGIRFHGSDSDDSTWGTYAMVSDIHLE